MRYLALLLLVVIVTGCAIGMRTPPAPRAFCEGYHVVLPGEYLGQIMIPVRDGLSIIRPLLAGDTVCMRRRPARPPQIPEFPDSAKP